MWAHTLVHTPPDNHWSKPDACGENVPNTRTLGIQPRAKKKGSTGHEGLDPSPRRKGPKATSDQISAQQSRKKAQTGRASQQYFSLWLESLFLPKTAAGSCESRGAGNLHLGGEDMGSACRVAGWGKAGDSGHLLEVHWLRKSQASRSAVDAMQQTFRD